MLTILYQYSIFENMGVVKLEPPLLIFLEVTTDWMAFPCE